MTSIDVDDDDYSYSEDTRLLAAHRSGNFNLESAEENGLHWCCLFLPVGHHNRLHRCTERKSIEYFFWCFCAMFIIDFRSNLV
jgi:hypothetical protein